MTKEILKRCPCPSHVGRRTLRLTAEFWNRSKSETDGFFHYCKKCSRAAQRKTIANHPEKYTAAYFAAATRRKKENNPEKYDAAYDAEATRKSIAKNPERYAQRIKAWSQSPESRAWCLERSQQRRAIKRLSVKASPDNERAKIRELDLASVLMRSVFGLQVDIDHYQITVKMARADRSVAHLCHRIANLRIITAADNSARNQNGHGYSRPCETLTLERLWQEPELVARLHRLQELRLPTYTRDSDGRWTPTPLPRN